MKIIDLILICHVINFLVAYCDSPSFKEKTSYYQAETFKCKFKLSDPWNSRPDLLQCKVATKEFDCPVSGSIENLGLRSPRHFFEGA